MMLPTSSRRGWAPPLTPAQTSADKSAAAVIERPPRPVAKEIRHSRREIARLRRTLQLPRPQFRLSCRTPCLQRFAAAPHRDSALPRDPPQWGLPSVQRAMPYHYRAQVPGAFARESLLPVPQHGGDVRSWAVAADVKLARALGGAAARVRRLERRRHWPRYWTQPCAMATSLRYYVEASGPASTISWHMAPRRA